MNLRLMGVVVVLSGVALAESPLKPVAYDRLRYTSFGVADPTRDLRVLEAFKAKVAERVSEAVAAAAREAARKQTAGAVRIAELEDEIKRAEGATSRTEQLKREARKRELARLKAAEPEAKPVTAPATAPDAPQVVVLVDTLPSEVEVHDGRLSSTNPSLEMLGHFDAHTRWSEHELTVIDDFKALALAAGGNVVVLSFHHGNEPQGECRGASGIVIRQPNFDPKKVTSGRLPAEI